MKRFLTTLATASLLSSAALAHEYKIGDLLIDHPVSYETPPTARTAAGYMIVTNTGTRDDLLVTATSGMPKTELHRTETDTNGVSRMIHQMNGIPIPAGESVTFEPGGLHVMFMGLSEAVQEGEVIPVTLTFQNAGTVDVEFNVEKRPAGSKTMNHGDHSNHGAATN